MKNLIHIFGETGQKIVKNLSDFVDELRDVKIVYNFTSNREFEEMCINNMDQASIQYWREILDRAHFSSTTSIIRTVDWVKAIDAAYESDNFLLFMSAIRALTEFSGDATYSLNQVPLTIAEHSANIRKILDGNEKSLFISTELDDSLRHYTHARKVSKNEATSENNHAKQTYIYVKNLEPYIPNIYDMYTELCGYAHPAAQSVGAHMRYLNENNWTLTVDPGKDLISDFIKNWQSQFSELPMLATNQALCTLKVLCAIDEKRYGSNFISAIDLSKIPLWVKCKSHIKP